MNAEIIAVGSELLTPQRIDTNSLYLTEELNQLGIEVVGKAVIGDDRARLADTVRAAVQLLVTFSQAAITAEVDLNPNTLNLKSQGRWITCRIALPDGYDVADIDPATVYLEGTVPADRTAVEDDKLMVKFDRSAVQALVAPGNVELTVTGELTDGTAFEGSDTIRVIDPPDDQ